MARSSFSHLDFCTYASSFFGVYWVDTREIYVFVRERFFGTSRQAWKA